MVSNNILNYIEFIKETKIALFLFRRNHKGKVKLYI